MRTENAVPSVFRTSLKRNSVQEHSYHCSKLTKTQKNTSSRCQFHEHSYCATKSPATFRRITINNEQHVRQRKRIRVLQQPVRRMKKKVDSMNDVHVIKELKAKFTLSENATDMLTASGSAITNDFFSRIDKQRRAGHLLRKKYTAALRQFSLTLNFYSARAYRYVRNTFDLALPHPSVLQTWYRSINGEPGFTKEAFDMLQLHAVNQSPKQVICNLTLDEMAIRKHTEWDGNQFRGYVDVGTGVEDDTLPAATEALVFMIVPLNAGWKLPVGYFLLNGMNGTDKANLIKQCICRLHDTRHSHVNHMRWRI